VTFPPSSLSCCSVAIAAVVLLGAPTPIFAQKGNETGLPLYPNTNTGRSIQQTRKATPSTLVRVPIPSPRLRSGIGMRCRRRKKPKTIIS